MTLINTQEVNSPAIVEPTQIANIDNHQPKKNFFSMPSLKEMEHLNNFCKIMAQAPFYQKMGPGGVMAVYLTAKEYNLPFMACMNGGIYTFDGKVTFSAIMINSMINNAGHHVDVIQLDDEKCILKFTRGDRKNDATYKPFIYEYTKEMANRAGYLSKQNWKTSLRDMLYNRCLTGGGRKHIPEVLVGVLGAGELVGDDSDQYVEPVTPVEVALQINSQEEKPRPMTISKDQAQELQLAFVNCSPKYQDTLFKTFGSFKPYPVHSFEELPLDIYDRVKIAVNKNATEYQQSLTTKEEILEVVNA